MFFESKESKERKEDNKCYNGGNKHKFEARYNELPNNNIRDIPYSEDDDVRSMLYYKEYVYDICTWCGKVIEKESNETN